MQNYETESRALDSLPFQESFPQKRMEASVEHKASTWFNPSLPTTKRKHHSDFGLVDLGSPDSRQQLEAKLLGKGLVVRQYYSIMQKIQDHRHNVLFMLKFVTKAQLESTTNKVNPH